MKTKKLINLLIVIFLCSSPLFGGGRRIATEILSDVGNGTSDQVLFGPENLLEITAGGDSSRVSIRIGSALSNPALSPGGSRAKFETWNLTLSAPLSKSGDLSDIATQDGLVNAFKATLAITFFSVKKKNPLLSPADFEALEQIYEKAKENARTAGLPEEKAEELERDSGTISTYYPEKLDTWDNYFWDQAKSKYLWGFEIAAGHEEFEFLDPQSLEELSETEAPWSARLFASIIPSASASLLTLGIEYQDTYEAADEKTLCPQGNGTTVIECKTGPAGGPSGTEKDLIFLNWRRLSCKQRLGSSLSVTYDFKSDVLSASLPLYFVRNEDKKLSGGVRFGWRDDTSGVQVGLFVTTPFEVFN